MTNYLVILSSVITPPPDKPTLKLCLVSFGVMFLSWLAAVLVAVLVALLLTSLGRSMTWFSHPLLIIPLYILPSFLALGEVNTQLVKRVHSLHCLQVCTHITFSPAYRSPITSVYTIDDPLPIQTSAVVTLYQSKIMPCQSMIRGRGFSLG